MCNFFYFLNLAEKWSISKRYVLIYLRAERPFGMVYRLKMNLNLMAKRLVSVAKELNVGSKTIVEFLIDKGFEVVNKPNAKISNDMENVLLKRFGDSKTTKEGAEKVVIGIRPNSSNKSEPEEKLKSIRR